MGWGISSKLSAVLFVVTGLSVSGCFKPSTVQVSSNPLATGTSTSSQNPVPAPTTAPPPPVMGIQYSEVRAVLSKSPNNCLGCHSSWMNYSEDEYRNRLVSCNNPSASILLLRLRRSAAAKVKVPSISGFAENMPTSSNSVVSDADVELLYRWSYQICGLMPPGVPTPSPTPVATPTPAATPTPTATPSPTPVATPTPTATPAAGPLETLFGTGVPVISSHNDSQGVNLGTKVRFSQNGRVLGVRFYKAAGAGSNHQGTLWSASGQVLASVVFSQESASGWQEARFAAPVNVTANTTYVVSYFEPNGMYVAGRNYFDSNRTQGSITGPSSGSSGGNGLYVYAAQRQIPDQSYQASSYYVDVIFQGGMVAPTPTPVATPTPTATPTATPTPVPTATPVPTPTPVGAVSFVFTLINADTDQPIRTLANNASINPAQLPTQNINIGITTTPALSGIGSARIQLNSDITIESAAPYSAKGDMAGDYNPWNPTAGAYTLTVQFYSAANATGTLLASGSLAFQVTAPPEVAPTGLRYSQQAVIYPRGQLIAPNLPSNAMGSITSYRVTPALPAGLSLNTTNGQITGTPTTAQIPVAYSVTGSNSAGSTTTLISIGVSDLNDTAATYENIRAQILQPKCLACHSAGGIAANLSTEAAVMQFVRPGDPLASDFFSRTLANAVNPMPPGTGLPAAESLVIMNWIAKGAPGAMPSPTATPNATPTPALPGGSALEPSNAVFRIGNRHFIASTLQQIFGSSANTAVNNLIMSKSSVSNLGGPCNGYSDIVWFNDAHMAPSSDCEIVASAAAPVLPISNTGREALRVRACDQIISQDAAVLFAAGLAMNTTYTAASIPAMNSSSITAAYQLFYQGKPAPTEAMPALQAIANGSQSNLEAWRFVLLTICYSPTWQVP